MQMTACGLRQDPITMIVYFDDLYFIVRYHCVSTNPWLFFSTISETAQCWVPKMTSLFFPLERGALDVKRERRGKHVGHC